MNDVMKAMLEESDIKLNGQVVEGMSMLYLESIIRHLDAVIKSGIATLSMDVPLIYKGYRKLTPKEDFYNNINSSISKNIVDISKNYIFKVEFGFQYDGIEINRNIALPYVDRGGYLRLSDANYVIVPVLSEYPISPAPGQLFIRLLRDKLKIQKMERSILVNGEKVPKQIIYSKSYKLLKNVNDVVPIALYMFVKYGFYETFNKYFKTKPILLVGDVDTKKYEEEYNVYTTVGMKPRNLQMMNYIPHKIKILVKKEAVTPFLEIVVSSLIYSFDMSPLFAMNIGKVAGKKEHVGTQFTFHNIDSESLFWITLLGKIIFKNKYSLDRIQVDMLEHMEILNGYLDNIIKEKLLEIGINIADFFDLIPWVIENFHELVMNYEKYSSKLSNRYIDVLYYILFDLIVGINKAFLEFKRTSSRKKLTEREINRLFNKYLSTKKVFNLIKGSGSGTNISILPVDNTTDAIFWKMSSILEDQNRGEGVKRSTRNVLPPNAKTLHAEDLVFGSMLHLIKKYPSPRFRVNPFVDIDFHTGKILITGDLEKSVDKLESMLVNKFEDQEILEREVITSDADLKDALN